MATSDPETTLAEYRRTVSVTTNGRVDISTDGALTVYSIRADGVSQAALADFEHELAMRDWTAADEELYHSSFIPEYGVLSPPDIYDHLYATGLLLHEADREARLKSAKGLMLSGVAVAGIFTFHGLMNLTWTLVVLGVPVGIFVILLGAAKLLALRPRRLPHGGKPTPAFLRTDLSSDGELTVELRLMKGQPDPANAQLLEGEVRQFIRSG